MFVNTAKQKMLEGQPVFGYSVGLGSPLAVEALSRCGIDFILVETQHGAWGNDGAILAFLAIAGGAATSMARVSRNDYTLIGKLLDQGALGIVVPMVDTVAQAQVAADACRFPPHGRRSWGVGRARAFGDDYFDRIDDEVFLAVQIESIQAVAHAEAILAVPGVDGCWIGPSDLALSMGIHPRDMGHDDRHRRALEQVLQACHNTGKIPGLAAGGPEQAVQRAVEGYRFLTAGGDAVFLRDGALAGLQTIAAYRARALAGPG